ncbi:hypothetical protein VPH35_004709 [Triticum aestivum]
MIICPTARGFLLVRDPTSLATFLWSHQSRSKIELPPLPLDVDDQQLVYCSCLLSDKPTAPGCVVPLAPPGLRSWDPFIWFCRVGDGQWVKHEYDIGTLVLPDWDPPEEKVVICPIAACRGKFYFNGMPDSLGVIDFCGPAPVFSSITIDETIDEDHGTVFLVESDGQLYMVCLLSVDVSEPYRGATVHRMDFLKQQWCKVDDLGGRAFLLSLYVFGASCSGDKCGLRQNCLYLPDPDEKTLQIFNVKGGSVELQKLDEAPVSDKSFWVVPTDP